VAPPSTKQILEQLINELPDDATIADVTSTSSRSSTALETSRPGAENVNDADRMSVRLHCSCLTTSVGSWTEWKWVSMQFSV
jgi:hypothetical protein